MQDEVLIAGFGRRGHAVGDIPGVRFKVQLCLLSCCSGRGGGVGRGPSKYIGSVLPWLLPRLLLTLFTCSMNC